jgi:hypothetical protein
VKSPTSGMQRCVLRQEDVDEFQPKSSNPKLLNRSICGSTALLLDLGRFFSFLIFYTVGRTPWTEDQPIARPLHTHRINAHKNIHALREIRTQDSSVPANEDSSCLRPRGHCDRP